MEKVIEKIKNEIVEILGKRIQDGKCSFCGSELNPNEWCECKEAKKKNPVYKKAYSKIGKLNDLISVSSSFKEAQRFYLNKFKTPELFEGMGFDDYLIECESEQKGFNTVFEYYNQAVKSYLTGMNLILLGKYGTGKTMLMSILCNALASEFLFSCKYANAVTLWQKITDSFKSNEKSVKDIVQPYEETEFLFLDDIDKVKPSDYVREIFYGLVNTRTEKRLPTIISANHSLEELDEMYYGEAIVSRLIANSKIVNFTHQNRRFRA